MTNKNDFQIKWTGGGSNPSGSTPFGFYDTDAQFQYLAPRAASWGSKNVRLSNH